MTDLLTYTGQCHCGAVKFEFEGPRQLHAYTCNCSICNMKRNTHVVVPQSRFHLLQGADSLTEYTFNTHQAKHRFCKVCGVQSFYIPRSNPDGYGITAWCIDSHPEGSIKFMEETFDGKNWEDAIKTSSITQESKV